MNALCIYLFSLFSCLFVSRIWRRVLEKVWDPQALAYGPLLLNHLVVLLFSSCQKRSICKLLRQYFWPLKAWIHLVQFKCLSGNLDWILASSLSSIPSFMSSLLCLEDDSSDLQQFMQQNKYLLVKTNRGVYHTFRGWTATPHLLILTTLSKDTVLSLFISVGAKLLFQR